MIWGGLIFKIEPSDGNKRQWVPICAGQGIDIYSRQRLIKYGAHDVHITGAQHGTMAALERG